MRTAEDLVKKVILTVTLEGKTYENVELDFTDLIRPVPVSELWSEAGAWIEVELEDGRVMDFHVAGQEDRKSVV